MRYARSFVYVRGCERDRAADGGGAGNEIGNEGARAIGKGLQHCPSLQELNFSRESTIFACLMKYAGLGLLVVGLR